jgi:hypothetical protein
MINNLPSPILSLLMSIVIVGKRKVKMMINI